MIARLVGRLQREHGPDERGGIGVTKINMGRYGASFNSYDLIFPKSRRSERFAPRGDEFDCTFVKSSLRESARRSGDSPAKHVFCFNFGGPTDAQETDRK